MGQPHRQVTPNRFNDFKLERGKEKLIYENNILKMG